MTLPQNKEALLSEIANAARFDFVYFWGHRNAKDGAISKSCLSQWYESLFTVGSESYKTAEHYMMVQKARLFGDQDTARLILEANTPNEAKSLGRKVRGFVEANWLKNRERIVFEGSLAKFSQNAALRAYLITTGNSILVEASPVDAVWGIGLSQDDPKSHPPPAAWPGLNLLGFALTKVRQQLESER